MQLNVIDTAWPTGFDPGGAIIYGYGCPLIEPWENYTMYNGPIMPSHNPTTTFGYHLEQPWVFNRWRPWQIAFGWYLEGVSPQMLLDAQAATPTVSFSKGVNCWGNYAGRQSRFNNKNAWRWRPCPRRVYSPTWHKPGTDWCQYLGPQKTVMQLEKEVNCILLHVRDSYKLLRSPPGRQATKKNICFRYCIYIFTMVMNGWQRN